MMDNIIVIPKTQPPTHVLETIEKLRVEHCANLAYVRHTRAGWSVTFRGLHGNEGCPEPVDYEAESTVVI